MKLENQKSYQFGYQFDNHFWGQIGNQLWDQYDIQSLDRLRDELQTIEKL